MGTTSCSEQRTIFNNEMMAAGGDLNIYGGIFNNVQGDSHTYHHNPNETGIHTLFQQIAGDAMHDSAAREPPPNCHADTRVEVMDVIKAWIDDGGVGARMFWLYGTAGAGKSAIMQAIAELLYGHRAPVAADFFFGRGKGRREIGRYLFPTIAYQLAINIPGLREHVDQIMRNDPSLPLKSLKVQLYSLIIQPLQMLPSHPNPTRTVLIDGLDECKDDDMQRTILQLLGEAVSKHQLPLRFLIASRPEPQIRQIFDTPTHREMTRRIALDDKFNPNKDIRKFLLGSFASIVDDKSHLMVDVTRPWPGECVIDLLVQNSCGQFIYPSTVMKFINGKYALPAEQLQIVLDPERRSSAFSDLDSLYAQILSTYPDWDMLKRVIGIIMILKEPKSAIVIEDILGLKRGKVRLVLQGLQSLLSGVEDDSKINIIHTSFRDYLLDNKRSGAYFIDEHAVHVQLSYGLFSCTSEMIRCGVGLGPSAPVDVGRPFHDDTRHYMFYYWKYHLREGKQDARDRVLAVVEEFQRIACNLTMISCDPLNAPLDELYLLLEIAENRSARRDTFPYSLISDTYRAILYQCFESLFPISGSVYDLFKILPAYLALQGSHLRTAADLFMVDEQGLRDIIMQNQIFMDPGQQNYPFRTGNHLTPLSSSTYSNLPMFNHYVCMFFKDGSQTRFNHISDHQFNLAYQVLSYIFVPSFGSKRSLWKYLDYYFRGHPDFLNDGLRFDSEAGVKVLRLLEGIQYDQLDRNRTAFSTFWISFKPVLRWLVNSQKAILPDDLVGRFKVVFRKTREKVLWLVESASRRNTLPFHMVGQIGGFPPSPSTLHQPPTTMNETWNVAHFVRIAHTSVQDSLVYPADRLCSTWVTNGTLYHGCCSGILQVFKGVENSGLPISDVGEERYYNSGADWHGAFAL